MGTCSCGRDDKIPATVVTPVLMEGDCVLSCAIGHCYGSHAHLNIVQSVREINSGKSCPQKAKNHCTVVRLKTRLVSLEGRNSLLVDLRPVHICRYMYPMTQHC